MNGDENLSDRCVEDDQYTNEDSEVELVSQNFENITRKRRFSKLAIRGSDLHISLMRKKWTLLSEKHLTDVGMDTFCYKNLKFFDSTNACYLQFKRVQFFNVCQQDCPAAFMAMLGSEGGFYFHGRRVCTKFLLASFRFNSNLQGSSSRTLKSNFG